MTTQMRIAGRNNTGAERVLLSGQHQLFLKTSSIRCKQMFGFQKREEKNGSNIRFHQTWTEGEGKHDVWVKNILFNEIFNKDSDIKISICNTHTRQSGAEPYFGCLLMTRVGPGRACPALCSTSYSGEPFSTACLALQGVKSVAVSR